MGREDAMEMVISLVVSGGIIAAIGFFLARSLRQGTIGQAKAEKANVIDLRRRPEADVPRPVAAPPGAKVPHAPEEAAQSADAAPAWALILRSPYAEGGKATSWLGGLPAAPAGFEWPRGSDGLPLNFVAQIDLGAIRSTNPSVPRPHWLPKDGTLLAFFGDGSRIRVLSAEEMANSHEIAPPEDLPGAERLDLHGAGSTFHRWIVDPLPYVDVRDTEASPLPNRLGDPLHWITTWGMAAYEAKRAHDAVIRDLEHGERTTEFMAKRSKFGAFEPHMIEKGEHHARMVLAAPKVVEALAAFTLLAEAQDMASAVDKDALAAIFRQRHNLAEVCGNYAVKFALLGEPKAVFKEILLRNDPLADEQGFARIEPGLHPFIDIVSTDFRGHAFLGLGWGPFGYPQDMRTKVCLLYVACDELLGTASDHAYGFSIWCEKEDVVAGRFEASVMMTHTDF